jgi:hypothetical protein
MKYYNKIEENYVITYKHVYGQVMPSTVATRSKAWTVFARTDAGIVGSNPTQGMVVYVLSVFVLFCVYVAALQRTDPPSKVSYWLCIGFRNWKSGQGPTKGYRAIDR